MSDHRDELAKLREAARQTNEAVGLAARGQCHAALRRVAASDAILAAPEEPAPPDPTCPERGCQETLQIKLNAGGVEGWYCEECEAWREPEEPAPVPEGEGECPYCAGSGSPPMGTGGGLSDVRCIACQGTGHVLSREYVELLTERDGEYICTIIDEQCEWVGVPVGCADCPIRALAADRDRLEREKAEALRYAGEAAIRADSSGRSARRRLEQASEQQKRAEAAEAELAALKAAPAVRVPEDQWVRGRITSALRLCAEKAAPGSTAQRGLREFVDALEAAAPLGKLAVRGPLPVLNTQAGPSYEEVLLSIAADQKQRGYGASAEVLRELAAWLAEEVSGCE